MTAYIKESGEVVTVSDIGELAETLTLIKPLTPFYKWDGMQWVTDTEAKYAAAITQAENERQRLLKHADAVMLDWRTELMLGEISDANRAKLSAWLAYKNEVKSVDVTTDPENVNWPVPPEA
nr:tail fiber assembly protein [Citrobacter freundii]